MNVAKSDMPPIVFRVVGRSELYRLIQLSRLESNVHVEAPAFLQILQYLANQRLRGRVV